MTDRMRGPAEVPAGYTRRHLTFLTFANLVTLLVITAFVGIVAAVLFLLGMALGVIYGVGGRG